MPIYSVEGRLGTGKSLFCVWRAQLALLAGRRVASNMDLRPWLLTPNMRSSYTRLPDKPGAFDLEAIGHGNPDSYDEDRNGVLILDELATWLNARSFQDKGRAHLIDWLVHARKLGWDVYLIVQDSAMIDRQVREALIEHRCKCVRMDKVKIPIVGSLLSMVHRKAGYFPRFHMVTARMGEGMNPIVSERWAFRGLDLYSAYDTRQVFVSNYEHGAHSVLAPWEWAPRKRLVERLLELVGELRKPAPRPLPPARPAPAGAARLVQLLRELPSDRRVSAWQSFQRAGRL